MSKVYLFLADGFETVEALAPADVMRRAGIEVVTVSIMGRRNVVSAQNVPVVADALYEDICFCDADGLVLPGGGTGTDNLSAHEPLRALLVKAHAEGKLVAAICAAPMVFGRIGILKGRKATCYPGCEGDLFGAEYTAAPVEKDGNIITGCGPGVSFDFGFAIVERLCGGDVVGTLRSQMQF
ncbi:MAG: DJ-1/PfpI family protein [Bacteroidaceae bacterium]|nr:DJ-1/PfpI family protein [Bacteroidaceae bacterium]